MTDDATSKLIALLEHLEKGLARWEQGAEKLNTKFKAIAWVLAVASGLFVGVFALNAEQVGNLGSRVDDLFSLVTKIQGDVAVTKDRTEGLPEMRDRLIRIEARSSASGGIQSPIQTDPKKYSALFSALGLEDLSVATRLTAKDYLVFSEYVGSQPTQDGPALIVPGSPSWITALHDYLPSAMESGVAEFQKEDFMGFYDSWAAKGAPEGSLYIIVQTEGWRELLAGWGEAQKKIER